MEISVPYSFTHPPTGIIIGGSKGGDRDARPPGGPNSFIFMQFSAKNMQSYSFFGSWSTLLRKILDPPLIMKYPMQISQRLHL